MLILEVKGRDSDQDRTKRRFLEEWVNAVNAHGGFGHWNPGTCPRLQVTSRISWRDIRARLPRNNRTTGWSFYRRPGRELSFNGCLTPLKRFVRSLDGLFNIGCGVRGGDEGGFELGRGEVGAAFQRVVEEFGVSSRIGFLG